MGRQAGNGRPFERYRGGFGLTKDKTKSYNNHTGTPIKCDCDRVIAFKRGGKIYVKCPNCKKWIAVLSIDKAQ